MHVNSINVICPHCQKEQTQYILIKDEKEILTQNTCKHCVKEFKIHPITHITEIV